MRRILREALRDRGHGPALIGHIGADVAESAHRLPLRAIDRVVDLDTLPADAPSGDGASVTTPVEIAVVAAASPTDLRRSVALADRLPEAVRVCVALAAVPEHWGPLVPTPPGLNMWNQLAELRSRRYPGSAWAAELFFLEPVSVGQVLAAAARSLGAGRRPRALRPLAALTGNDAAMWRPGDPEATTTPAAGPVGTRRVTPAADTALRCHSGPLPAWGDERVPHLDRPECAALSWEHFSRPEAARSVREWNPGGLAVDDIPPIDERAVNPIGFLRSTRPDVARLAQSGDRWVLTDGGRELLRVPEAGTITDRDLASLRPLRGVEIEWGRHTGPSAAVRAVAGLAAGGVPLLTDSVPAWAECLGAELRALLTEVSPHDLADELRREEHSVRLRRAALRTHGSAARWRRIGERLGLGPPPEPSVSVILCTQRPDMLGFALRQVARQRLARVEVVLTLHGFDRRAPGVAEAVADFAATGHEITVHEADGDTVYGTVLGQAAERASGSLIAKMDDDDWYGPEHLADMLLARDYSGADVVGCGQEFVYLEELDLTVRRGGVTERAWRSVAGGTLLMDRSTLEDAGGFRPLPRAIDTQLLTTVAHGGGRIYRTHGLGYVLRRRPAGHTWSEGAGYFLRDQIGQWRGWRPSRLLEPEPPDVPEGATLTGAIDAAPCPQGTEASR